MSVAVVDSGGANIASVLHALRRLGAEPEFTADPSQVRSAERVILPGVGAASGAMEKLRSHGLVEVLRELKQPVLGVCLGMQLLFESTDEGDVGLLGLIPAGVQRLVREEGLRIPHMGWNKVSSIANDNFADQLHGQWFYFVHSYAAPLGPWSVASCEHGQPFSAVVRQRNFLGVQFHPERSAEAGSMLLERFLAGEDV